MEHVHSSVPGSADPVRLADHRAVLFDLDGVLTPTASVHARVWAELFDGFLAATHPTQARFSADDYLVHVDGRPRLDGIRSFLASRNLVLREGRSDDPPGHSSVHAVGNLKNDIFRHSLERDGIAPFPGVVRLLDHLAAEDVRVAVVSSSRNARPVLRAAGLSERFDVIVDGELAASLSLAGKPSPAMFLYAAGELGVAPSQSVVVEDAVAGVVAGRRGGFALVIGVDRGAGIDALLSNGADVVIREVAELLPPGTSGAPREDTR